MADLKAATTSPPATDYAEPEAAPAHDDAALPSATLPPPPAAPTAMTEPVAPTAAAAPSAVEEPPAADESD